MHDAAIAISGANRGVALRILLNGVPARGRQLFRTPVSFGQLHFGLAQGFTNPSSCTVGGGGRIALPKVPFAAGTRPLHAAAQSLDRKADRPSIRNLAGGPEDHERSALTQS